MAGTEEPPVPDVSGDDEELLKSLTERLSQESDPNRHLLGFARLGRVIAVENALREGADVNTRHPSTGATALHYAAAVRARAVINRLAKCENIDYLICDNNGRLPSALAYEVAADLVIGRYLVKKQGEQARARGIDLKSLIEQNLT